MEISSSTTASTPSLKTNQTKSSSSSSGRMGSSILRHCRRRTQSEPPKNYQRNKLKLSKESKQKSLDVSSNNNSQNQNSNVSVDENRVKNLNLVPKCRPRSNYLPSSSTSSLSHMAIPENDVDQNTQMLCKLCLKEKRNQTAEKSSLKCPNCQEQQRQQPINTRRRFNAFSTSNDVEKTLKDVDVFTGQAHTNQSVSYNTTYERQTSSTYERQTSSSDSDGCPVNEYTPLQTELYKNFSLDFHNEPSNERIKQLIEHAPSSPADTSCFPKLACCRKTKRNKNQQIVFDNNNTPLLPSSNNHDYSRLSSTSSVGNSSIDGASLRTASTNFTMSTASDNYSRMTLSTSTLDNQSKTTLSQTSIENLSRDSGFDEPPCLLNLIDATHKCKGLYSCKKKDYLNLNMHLKSLMMCMPKSFSDTEAIPNELSNCSGVNRHPYLSKRRNAICETSVEMRDKFNEALCAFLTLQAMAKYEFL